ncbi:hypothetical protein NDN08_004500 [Rhodosorus marinus]|uniref:Uncharacterized protein n=1 Tax=Rhodosorus marinus TaxID=101924 RepID=A0AAV8UQ11_9RHOD|nr:hypothetical protein NDN08_004500 [Rhodosorus marinus]
MTIPEENKESVEQDQGFEVPLHGYELGKAPVSAVVYNRGSRNGEEPVQEEVYQTNGSKRTTVEDTAIGQVISETSGGSPALAADFCYLGGLRSTPCILKSQSPQSVMIECHREHSEFPHRAALGGASALLGFPGSKTFYTHANRIDQGLDIVCPATGAGSCSWGLVLLWRPVEYISYSEITCAMKLHLPPYRKSSQAPLTRWLS